ncbi:MAG: HAMP domain-containing histidine kinase [Planctomycetes bacterium]|nr:HAMP domain-containing histidine kinase [Planctomycetota bacterium]
MSHEAGGGVVLVDAQGKVLLHSRDATELLGNPADFAEVWRDVHGHIEKELHARPPSEGELVLDVALVRDRESRRLFVRALRLEDTSRGGYLALVTGRRSLDALQSSLYLASQMRRLHTTYRHAAHDLRAPLNAIAINLDLLRQDISDPGQDGDAAGKRVELLQIEVTRLSRMLQMLLAESQPPRHTAHLTDLRRLVLEVVELVAPQAAQLAIVFDLDLPNFGPSVLAARDLLKQALLNLLLNSLEAMPGGGPIEIALDSDDRHASITIRDHGIGIPARSLEQIFRMHFTTKTDSSGIGLFTTRAAIESMSGSLALESVEGSGTTVRIELPLAVLAPRRESTCSTS